MGRLLGTKAADRDSAHDLKRRTAALSARTEFLSTHEPPRVLVLIGDEALYHFGAGSSIHIPIEEAGGRSITKSIDTKTPT